MRFMPLEYAKENQIIAKHIYNDDGRILLKKGTNITNNLIRRLNNRGIYSIYIEDGYSDYELEDIIRPELRNRAINSIKNTYKKFDFIKNDYDQESEMNAKVKKTVQSELFSFAEISKDLIEELFYNKDLIVNLADIKSKDNFIFQHSINVAVISLLMGIELKLSKKQLGYLAMGALLHDIGKIFIDLPRDEKNYKESDWNLLKLHVIRGYEFLRGADLINGNTKIIVLQHHENYDGTGYPKGLVGEKIHLFSRIIRIANDYDLLSSDTNLRRALPPNEVVEYIIGGSATKYDLELVSIFVSKINPYPEGSHVKLSNGLMAVVLMRNDGMPLRPIVKTIDKGVEIDLVKELNIVIESIVY